MNIQAPYPPAASAAPDQALLSRLGLKPDVLARFPWLATFWAIVLVGSSYSIAGALGVVYLKHVLAPILAGTAPTVGVPWLAVGIGVAGLMRYGLRAWPGVFLGSLITWGLVQGDPWISVVVDAVGETLSIVLIVNLLRAWHYRASLERYQDALILIAAACLGRLLSTLIDGGDAFADVWWDTRPDAGLVMKAIGVERHGDMMVVTPALLKFLLRWWANSSSGVLLIVPLLAVFTETESKPRWGAESLSWLLAAAGWMGAAVWLPGLAPRLLLLAIALTLVVWAALRFGVVRASFGTLLFSMTAALAFAAQVGAFAGLGGRETLVAVWGFIALLTCAGLFLTALVSAHRHALAELTTSVERYRRLLLANPTPMWAEDRTTRRIVLVNEAALQVYGYREAEFLQLTGEQLTGDQEPESQIPPEYRGQTLGPIIARHRTAAGGELEVEVTPVRIESEVLHLQLYFVELLDECNELRAAALEAADLEREHLSQEIRTGLGPSLARLGSAAERLMSAANLGEALDPQLLNAMDETAAVSTRMCRQLSRGASAIHYESDDLIEALNQLPEVLAAGDGPAVHVSVRALAPVTLSVERCEHVYRIAEDAVRSALLRPGALNVFVLIDVTSEQLRISVEDDAPAAPAPRDNLSQLTPIGIRAAATRVRLEHGLSRFGGHRVSIHCAQAVEATQPISGAPLREPTQAAPSQPAVQPGAPSGSLALAGLQGLILSLSYLAAGAVGLWFLHTLDATHVTLIPGMAIPWLANGIAVAGLLLGGLRLAPAVFIGSLLLWGGLAHDPWLTVTSDAIGETLGAMAAAQLLIRWGLHREFDRLRDLGILLAAAMIARSVPMVFDIAGLHVALALAPHTLSPEMAASVAPDVVRHFGLTAREWNSSLLWWINGVAGILLLVPILVPPLRALRRRPSWSESAVMALALAGIALAIAAGPSPTWRLPMLALGVAVVAFAAVRFGVALAGAATLVLSLSATVGYGWGLGAFAEDGTAAGPEMLWEFIGILFATGLAIATVTAGYDQALQALMRLKERYTTLFEAIPRPVFAYAANSGRITMVNAEAQRLYGYTRQALVGLSVRALEADPGALDSRPGPEPAATLVVSSVHRTHAGEPFEVELSTTRVEMSSEAEYLCFALDVTERNELRRRVLEASDGESRRLAHELHDGLAPTLTALHLGIANLHRVIAEGGSARVAAVTFVATALKEARRIYEQILSGLSPLEATGGDLLRALGELRAHLPPGSRDLLSVHIDGSGTLDIPLTMREHLYQIAREGVNNALKHAHAHQITVRLEVTATHLTLAIEDDGIGFDAMGIRSGGLGLKSLALRAAALRGRFSILRRPAGGTAIICRCAKAAA
jgi:PAS domain S-box-containing protein